MTKPVAYLYTSPSGAQELWFTSLSARERAQGWTAVPLCVAADARAAERAQIVAWYRDKGYLLDEDDVPCAIERGEHA